MGGEYEDWTILSLNNLSYLSHFLMIFIWLYSKNKKKLLRINYLKFLFPVFFLIIIESFQLIYLSSVFDSTDTLFLIIYFFRVIIILFSYCIYFNFFYERSSFINALLNFTKISIFFSLIFLINNFIFESSFQVHISQGVSRIQGFLSEPSAFAAPLSIFFIFSLIKKNYLLSLISLFCIYYTHSLSALGTLIFALLLFLSNQKIKGFLIYAISITTIVIFISSYYVYSEEFTSINRVLNIFQNISLYDINSDNLRQFDLDRFWGLLLTFETLIDSNLFFHGLGLNGSSYILFKMYGEVIDFGIIAYLISSFGVILGSIFLIFLIKNSLRIYFYDKEIGYVLLIFLFSVLFNSAGGIVVYLLPLTMGIFPQIFKVKKIKV